METITLPFPSVLIAETRGNIKKLLLTKVPVCGEELHRIANVFPRKASETSFNYCFM